jgi:hypothetical protein
MDFGVMPRRSDQFCRGRHPASIYDLQANSFMICRDWSINSGASAGACWMKRRLIPHRTTKDIAGFIMHLPQEMDRIPALGEDAEAYGRDPYRL